MNGFVLEISGIVQGVGFRPFVKKLADSMNISGSVRNTSTGVTVEIICSPDKADNFLENLKAHAPPLSHVVSVSVERARLECLGGFVIKPSAGRSGTTLVSPDIAMCAECAKEIASADDRRVGYAFTNCTNCGPRYSITASLPYDRPNTVMKVFDMCRECGEEYENPADRRFHAQPVACPVCGPEIWLNLKGTVERDPSVALALAAEHVNSGGIIGLKGLGGYHLICDAFNAEAVSRLRNLKNRGGKPFAVMCRNAETFEKYADPEGRYKEFLTSPQAPVVIFPWKNHPLAPEISPGSCRIGVMVPYTPLHALLFERLKTDFIVATSGNLRGEPIAVGMTDAEENLKPFTDVFIHHNRPILSRVDDSVLAVTERGYTLFRRARGFVPYPVMIKSDDTSEVFAAGANLKSAVAFYKDGYAFLSQHIGDLDGVENFAFYREVYEHMKNLFGITPSVAVSDLHPGYRSSAFADGLGIKRFRVQHHVAHFCSCLAENSCEDDAVGIIMDGFGLGADGEGWGGEFFLKKGKSVIRKASLRKFLQPGMDGAAKHPYRMLFSYLYGCSLLEQASPVLKKRLALSDEEISLLTAVCEGGINSVFTSAAGRLFEAAGSLLTGKRSNGYEGELAIELENMADPDETGSYEFSAGEFLDPRRAFEEMLSDLSRNVPLSAISARFHNGFSEAAAEIAVKIAREAGAGFVALSGGVFQNITLLDKTCRLIERNGLVPLTHTRVPANDGGIALGQLYAFLRGIVLE